MLFLRDRIFPVFVTTFSILVTATQVSAFEPHIAQVTATEVNVRSGPSTNYYVVIKLQAGDRVDVREQEEGWYGIVPPPGCFSLISKHYVDLDGKGGGVVNGNNVRVRAGSNYDPNRYAVQVKLSEGAEVEVLDDGPEGFLKIKPPNGAYVWIHSELAARASESWVDPDSAKMTSKKTSHRMAPSSAAPTMAAQNKTDSTDKLARPSSNSDVTQSTATSNETKGIRPGFGPRKASTESTDRVAVYTWTDEAGGNVKRVESNSVDSGIVSRTVTTRSDSKDSLATSANTKSVSTTPKMSREQSASANKMTQPTVLATSQPEISTSANTPSPPKTTPANNSNSNTRSTQFSSDSTGKTAIIKWNDSTGNTVSQSIRTMTSSAQPITDTQIARTQAPSVSPNPQSLSNTHSMTTQPIHAESSANRSHSTSTTAYIQPSQTTTHVSSTSTHQQTQVTTSPSPTPVQTNTVSVIPFTGVDARAELKLIDEDLRTELDKPMEQRQFGELMARYRGVMRADVDEASRLYAERRIQQLEVLSFRINAVGQINNIVTEVVETRHTASQQRSTMTTVTQQPRVGFAATGELRESMVFSSPVGPRRYRLIDPNESVPRTLCYVEIPRDSSIDISRYLGRIVGVRASRDFVETGNVDPISVLVASSIELVGSNTAASVSTTSSHSSPGSGIQPAGISMPTTTSSDTDQIAIRPMEPTYNP